MPRPFFLRRAPAIPAVAGTALALAALAAAIFAVTIAFHLP